jgi:uncharacterized integral membrane protein
MAQQIPGGSPSGTTNGQGARLGGGAIASIAGIGALVVFMLQNREDVRLDFLFWGFTWPVWLVTLVSALVGAFVGIAVARPAGPDPSVR